MRQNIVSEQPHFRQKLFQCVAESIKPDVDLPRRSRHSPAFVEHPLDDCLITCEIDNSGRIDHRSVRPVREWKSSGIGLKQFESTATLCLMKHLRAKIH